MKVTKADVIKDLTELFEIKGQNKSYATDCGSFGIDKSHMTRSSVISILKDYFSDGRTISDGQVRITPI